MQITLALHARLATCFLLAGVVGCMEAQTNPSPDPEPQQEPEPGDGTDDLPVEAADRAPQLGANLFSGPSGFRITGQIAASDLDGDPLTYSMPSPISGALIEMDSATGRFVFEPLPALAGDELVPVAVVGNGKVAVGKVPLRLEPVSFAGTWQASDVRVDEMACDRFTLPIETDASGTVSFGEHDVRCRDDETTTYEPLLLQRDVDSPSSLHASQYLPIGEGSFVHVTIAIEPIPTKPNVYRYVETFSGAFEQVTTATLSRAALM